MLQNLVNSLVLASIYVLFALGLSLVWGTIGILNFAHGGFFMFAAFINYLLVRDVRLPMIALAVIGTLVGAALSVAVQILAFGPILKRSRDVRSADFQILVAGIGLAAIPLAIAQKVTADNPFGFNNSSFAPHTYVVHGLRVSNAQIVIFACGLLLSVGMAIWLRRSKSGLALRAIGIDAETASMMGVNAPSLAILAMAVAGALAGLAGTLLTFYLGALIPESGDYLLLKAFAAIVLGGIGSVGGAMLGALVLAVAETVVLTQTSGQWVDAVSFGVILVVLLVRPRGLFGRQEVRRT